MTIRRILSLAGALTLTGASLVGAPAHSATVYKACVKKSSGETRMLLKGKKCKKGWKKVTWKKVPDTGAPGPSGPQGGTGPVTSGLGVVVDATGAVVGDALGSLLPELMFVLIDGGVFTYLGNGLLYGVNSVSYATATCTDVPFLYVSDEQDVAFFVTDRQFRTVTRSIAPTFGPAVAYKTTGTSTAIANLQTYWKNEAGACQVDALRTGFRVNLEQIPAPPDRPGPLQIR